MGEWFGSDLLMWCGFRGLVAVVFVFRVAIVSDCGRCAGFQAGL